jgi:hypothetical protein
MYPQEQKAILDELQKKYNTPFDSVKDRFWVESEREGCVYGVWCRGKKDRITWTWVRGLGELRILD